MLTHGYVALLAVIALEVPLALALRDRVDREVRTQAAGEAAVVAAAAGDLMTGSSRPALARLARTAAVTVRGRVLVVDARGRVLGLEGLVVADASIVPSVPRANTNLTVAAVAEKVAETL